MLSKNSRVPRRGSYLILLITELMFLNYLTMTQSISLLGLLTLNLDVTTGQDIKLRHHCFNYSVASLMTKW